MISQTKIIGKQPHSDRGESPALSLRERRMAEIRMSLDKAEQLKAELQSQTAEQMLDDLATVLLHDHPELRLTYTEAFRQVLETRPDLADRYFREANPQAATFVQAHSGRGVVKT